MRRAEVGGDPAGRRAQRARGAVPRLCARGVVLVLVVATDAMGPGPVGVRPVPVAAVPRLRRRGHPALPLGAPSVVSGRVRPSGGGQVRRPPSRGPRVGRHWARRRDRADGVVWWAFRCRACGIAGPWALTQGAALLAAWAEGWEFDLPLTAEVVLCPAHRQGPRGTVRGGSQGQNRGGA